MATVKLFGNLRKYIEGPNPKITGASVKAVVDMLCSDNPLLCEVLLEDGEVRPHFKITLNGHDIALAQGMDTAVDEDDQLAIFSPIAGG